MDNKQQIKKLRDMAELAWAAYGYFHCVDNKFDIKDEDKIVSLENVLDITHKNSKIINERGSKIGKLDGDFTPTQAKRFFEKYELLNHQPNTSSGFSATLFQDKESKEYILAIRGTENGSDIKADAKLFSRNIPQDQYFDMLLFYQDCIQKNHITKSTYLTITGHSLGGTLAQLFALSFASNSNENPSIINEVYTFNILRNVA